MGGFILIYQICSENGNVFERSAENIHTRQFQNRETYVGYIFQSENANLVQSFWWHPKY